jgi:hypothetical protein
MSQVDCGKLACTDRGPACERAYLKLVRGASVPAFRHYRESRAQAQSQPEVYRRSAGWPRPLILRVFTNTVGAPLLAPVGTEEIANLFCDEVLTSVKRSVDVLKPEWQRRVLPKPRA